MSKRAFGKVGAFAIEGVIGGDVRAAVVREQVSSAGGRDIDITINSDGGSVTEGIAIYHAIRNASGTVTATVTGIAASMASVILQAADVRRVTRGSYVMIHNPWSGTQGDADEMEKTADLLRKMESDMLDIYEARTGLDRDKIAKMMSDETYMSAEEAVKYGFADEIADAEARMNLDAVARLRNPPEAIKRLIARGSSMTDEEKAKMKALEEENAALKAKLEEDEKAEDEDEDKEEKAESEPKHNAEEDEDEDEKQARAAIIANARRLTGRKSLGEVAGALRALGSAGAVSAISARKAKVDELFAAGKLAPVDREWAMSASEQEFSGYVKAMGKTQIAPVGVAHKPPAAPVGQVGSDELTEAEKALQKASGLKKADIIAARTATYTAEAGKDD